MSGVPWLRHGVGLSPADGGCVLQIIDWIDRTGWTDDPKCVDPVIARLAVQANDALDDEHRQDMLDLVPRIMGTRTVDTVVRFPRISFQLALFLTRWSLSRETQCSVRTLLMDKIEEWTIEPTQALEDVIHAYGPTCNRHNLKELAQAINVAPARRNVNDRALRAMLMASASHSLNQLLYCRPIPVENEYTVLVKTLDEFDRITERPAQPTPDYTDVCAVMAGAS